jgi:hypothetical protein
MAGDRGSPAFVTVHRRATDSGARFRPASRTSDVLAALLVQTDSARKNSCYPCVRNGPSPM